MAHPSDLRLRYGSYLAGPQYLQRERSGRVGSPVYLQNCEFEVALAADSLPSTAPSPPISDAPGADCDAGPLDSAGEPDAQFELCLDSKLWKSRRGERPRPF